MDDLEIYTSGERDLQQVLKVIGEYSQHGICFTSISRRRTHRLRDVNRVKEALHNKYKLCPRKINDSVLFNRN